MGIKAFGDDWGEECDVPLGKGGHHKQRIYLKL